MTSLRRLVEPSSEARPAAREPPAGGDDLAGAGREGSVLVADGVGGFDVCGTALRYVLAAEKLPYAVEVFSWGHGFGRWFADLTDAANRDEKARLMAESARRYKAERPRDPVFLVAKSGGAGVVVKALELLGEKQVERAVMLAPALSPTYDLSCALRALRRELVVFWSPLDVFILGIGTTVIRNSRSEVDSWCGNGWVPRARNRRKAERKKWRAIRQAAPDSLAAADGGLTVPGRSFRDG